MRSVPGDDYPPRRRTTIVCTLFIEAVVVATTVVTLLGLFTITSKADDVNWDAIAQCESGGNWAANTGNGLYGGLQISQATWDANGGVGSPAAASPQRQIEVADNIMNAEGPGAWPKCGSCSRGDAPLGSLTHVLTLLAAETGGCTGTAVD
ncbi:transglycosylase family protein [Mycobacterium decipiens]|uniref:transglycosylase family protein n=1 Tax=Mycobacterium decipiens TaxID=1430326 RepID=UPI002418B46C|nr:transglycosylase family protein [Mycobacterium decipiens]